MGRKKNCASPWQDLKMDTFRQTGKFSIGNLVKAALTKRTFRPIVTLRLCQAASWSHGLLHLCLPILKTLHLATTQLAGIDLPWRTEIGSGFCIAHGWGIVVNVRARIGKNVTLLHGVTLGQLDRIGSDGQRTSGYPTLEDEVWVGPHAIIVGNVTVGRGSIIAGGAAITRSVPPHTVMAGNPGEILRRDCVPDVSNPAPVSTDDNKI
jgi:serine O-acetyltransferase